MGSGLAGPAALPGPTPLFGVRIDGRHVAQRNPRYVQDARPHGKAAV